LRRIGAGRIALEVDGVPWRVVPDEVVIRARLALGLVLDRPVLREIGRELRRAEALTAAGRVLAHRELSEAALRGRLERRGIAPVDVAEAAEALRRVGALDDVRFARSRARWLCERGWGDEAILARLEAEGAPQEAARDAVSQLAPEFGRARPLIAGLAPEKAARLLARRGFAPDTVEGVVQVVDVDTGAELG
jgi:SOS response regulatory protein OraA/RecX